MTFGSKIISRYESAEFRSGLSGGEKAETSAIADVIRAVKADTESAKLQQQFYEDAKHPLSTRQ